MHETGTDEWHEWGAQPLGPFELANFDMAGMSTTYYTYPTVITRVDPVLPTVSSFAQLGPKLKVCGPPPPCAPIDAHESALTISNPFEETAVSKATWRWQRDIERCLQAHEGQFGQPHIKGLRWVLRRFPGDIWPRAGVDPAPTNARHITRAHVRALRESPVWAPKSRSHLLQALRLYVRWKKLPLALERGIWTLNASAINLRWLTREQLVDVWTECQDDYDRLVVAATGYNGLRRVELLRLRLRDLVLMLPDPKARIWGKASRGAEESRTIRLSSRFYGALLVATQGKPASERVFPWERAAFDARLARLGKMAGLPFHLAGHTLRRTFGRLAYEAGVPVLEIQHIYGHHSVEMTTHYIGVDLDRMGTALARFEQFVETGV